MSSTVIDAAVLFASKAETIRRARLSASAPTYEAVLIENMSVGELMHLLRHAPVHLSTEHGHRVIRRKTDITTPPDAA